MKLMNDTIAPQDADTETDLAITEALAAAKTHQRAGRVRETASIFNKILSFDPDNIEALKGMAEISCITKNPHAALPIYAKILNQAPEDIDSLTNRGVILMQMGDAEASEFSFRKVLKVQPDNIDGLNNLGTCLIEQNRFDEAKSPLLKATKLAPDKAASFYNLGVLYRNSTPDNIDVQLQYFEKTLEIDPDYTEALINLSNIYGQQNAFERSLYYIEKALLTRPDDPLILFNKGITLRMLTRIDNAIECLKAARNSSKEPHLIDYEIGNSHYMAGRLKEATAFYVASVGERKNFKQGFIALGKTLAEVGQFAKAKEAFLRAGSEVEAQQRISALDIITGDEDPWKVFGKLFDAEELSICSKDNKWTGDLTEKSLSIHTVGMQAGEIILFCRLLEELKHKSKKIRIIIPQSMESLIPCFNIDISVVLESNFSQDLINDASREAHLYAVPSLLDLENGVLPKKDKYIWANQERERLWNKSIFERNEANIGLCWSTSGLLTGPYQELKLEEFEPIIELEGAQFINMTPLNSDTQKGHLRDLNVVDFTDNLRDHEDLLAAIDSLDLLITADVTAAHLAGALNKRVIVLLPLFPNWHWGYKNEHALYYPNTKLIRQSVENNWDRPIQRTRSFLITDFGLS